VPLFAFGPGRPVGLLDGPEIGKITAHALGLDLVQLNARLVVDVAQAIPGAKISVEADAPDNLVVRIAAGAQTATLPVNKNLLILDGQSIELEGVVVYVPNSKKVYAPLQAVQHILGQPISPLPVAE
jgi:alkaline phosphatase